MSRLTGLIAFVALLGPATPHCAAEPPLRATSANGEEWVWANSDYIRPELNPVFQAKYGLYVAMVKGTGVEQDRAIQVAIAGARFYSPEAKAAFLPLLLRGLKSDNLPMRRDAAWDLVFATFARIGDETFRAHKWTATAVASQATIGGTQSRAYLRPGSGLGVFWACPPGPRLPPSAGVRGTTPGGIAMQKKVEQNYGPATARTRDYPTPQANVLQQQLLQQQAIQQQLQQLLNCQLQQQLLKLLTAKDDELDKALKDKQPIVRLLALQVAASRNRNDDIVDRLSDPAVEIRQAARALLYQLSEGKDFGPAPDANADTQAKAQKQWKEWLEKNKPKPLVPDNLDELAKSASLSSSEKK